MTKPQKVLIPRENIIQVVRVGLIATSDTADGKLIPGVTIDTGNRNDIDELIENHRIEKIGDVASTWGKRAFFSQSLYLNLEFSHPMNVSFALEFQMPEKAFSIDLIMMSRGLYLQSSKVATKLSDGLEEPKILVEVPPGSQPPYWEKLYFDCQVKKLRKQGLPRKEARIAAKDLINQQRKLNSFKM